MPIQNSPSPQPIQDQPTQVSSVSGSKPSNTTNGAPNTPDLALQLDTVNHTLWQYMLGPGKIYLLLLMPVVIVWEVLGIILFVRFLNTPQANSNVGDGRIFIYFLLMPVFVLLWWLHRLRKKFEDKFLEDFATANHLSFTKTGVVDTTYGSIFRIGHDQKVSDIITGSYAKGTFRLFLYELTIGSGRSQVTYEETVMEFSIPGQLPNLLLVDKGSKNSGIDFAGAFVTKNILSLEGDFDQYFTLYAPQGNEIEALQVFSPDTMAFLESESKDYTVEFAGNRIYIYAGEFISSTKELTHFMAVAKELVEKIEPLASRLQNDSAIIATPVNITQSRNLSSVSNKVVNIMSIVLAIVSVIILIYLTLTDKASPESLVSKQPTTITPQQVSSGNINDPPYCGTKPAPTMPPATREYVQALIEVTPAQVRLSNTLIEEKLAAHYNDLKAQIAIDNQFLQTVRSIQFPPAIAGDALAQQNAIEHYDNLLAQAMQEISVTDAHSIKTLHDAIQAATKARSAASAQLRNDLGLPESTCFFYKP